MVSGLHTGRSKIVSFIRRAHRLGLRLVSFPTPASGGAWPDLEEEEKQVQAGESATFASEEALAHASELVLEMQVLSDMSEEVSDDQIPADIQVQSSRIWQAKSKRVNDIRRTFVVEEREEEKVENQGVHIRNRWMTFLALTWQHVPK
jgi:nicotinamide N-methyltransferase